MSNSTSSIPPRTISRFNGLFLGEREDSQATTDDVRLHALQMANSASDDAMGWFVLTHDARTNSLMMTYSDKLKEQLGFQENHYLMVEAGTLTGDEINRLRGLNTRLSPDVLSNLESLLNTFSPEVIAKLVKVAEQLNSVGVVSSGFNSGIGGGGVTVFGSGQ